MQDSERPLATAGQLKNSPKINDTFVCLYGDSIYEFPLKTMIENHLEFKNRYINGSCY